MRLSPSNRLAAATALGAAAVLLIAGPASAHVTVQPSSVPKNATDQTFAFRVPNEDDKNSTVKVEIDFPTDHPIPSALVAPVPGWTDQIQTTDGDITDVVSQIVWTGGQIAPGHYQDFTVDLGALPDGTDKVVFKALQTYGDGNIVRWIDEAQDGQKEPEHPAPVLKLTAATAAIAATGGLATPAPSAAATAPAASTAAAKASSSDSTARTLGIAGIVVGVLGAVTGVVLGRRGRKADG
ncbi:YcnI family protein, partial [Kitasatospora sp. NPDC056531]|uniref:YcnI family copper-binding membrane protein n=1 Tax=Kitasatospora sp. NPDC056531 TaxID=3345856 RepID=UPI0036B811FA